ncbi:cupin [Leptolyngbya sp. 'hensonii']|nr:cupin [Leptolyngbya sp. 'hensonii']
MHIQVDHHPTADHLTQLGVSTWPTWSKEISEFPWTYEAQETCYLLEGAVEVTPEGGSPVSIGQGDLVVFPTGMSCTWNILSPVRKHYKFE